MFSDIGIGYSEFSTTISSTRSSIDKQAQIIEYLKVFFIMLSTYYYQLNLLLFKQVLQRPHRATNVDFKNDLNIDLNDDYYLMNMLKSNPKVDMELLDDGSYSFQYRVKYEISDLKEMLHVINRESHKSGVLESDIRDCYPDIESDCRRLIVGGDIIALKNKEKKSYVMYPRGKAYLTELSGNVKAKPGSLEIETKSNLSDEIRRGDAIKIDQTWFRVSSSTNDNNQRAAAPFSVTSDKELSDKNVYIYEFNEKKLPLDGEYDGEIVFGGRAVRHGTTNDIRKAWFDTMEQINTEFKEKFDDATLDKELVRLDLISKPGTALKRVIATRKETTNKKVRKQRVSTSGTSNTHLIGTLIERVAEEMYQKKRDEN